MACACRGACHCKFTLLTDQTIGSTLVAQLTSVADCIRNIGVKLGARQYKVNLVWTQWSGGERGIGNESVLHEVPLLPTPLVRGLDAVTQTVQSFGLQEVGNLRLSQISPRYNEDFLMGRDVVVTTGFPLPADVDFHWEIEFLQNTPTSGKQRRFTPANAPSKHPTSFEWVLDLARASSDRDRDGTLP